ncbi:transmembrane 220 family protein [Aurantibacter crassamenti]|uniref:transmembrane 220 family protein n=1 Tax=Aurantibacter crassamenti TaxID=1837375 RepID=UPI0019395985|nr:transmembrane 220 family protein [Aurantibacter crassamenti]MBM1107849.1 transmembrane 220 family protein [Aurantibacter crassamenti]
MKSMFKLLGFIFAVLFIISAVLQYNDPDSLIWIIIWAIAGLISLAFALNKVSFLPLLISGLAALVGFFYCYPEKFEGFEIGGGDIKNVEEGREAFGLLIIAIVLLVFALRAYKVRKLKI